VHNEEEGGGKWEWGWWTGCSIGIRERDRVERGKRRGE